MKSNPNVVRYRDIIAFLFRFLFTTCINMLLDSYVIQWTKFSLVRISEIILCGNEIRLSHLINSLYHFYVWWSFHIVSQYNMYREFDLYLSLFVFDNIIHCWCHTCTFHWFSIRPMLFTNLSNSDLLWTLLEFSTNRMNQHQIRFIEQKFLRHKLSLSLQFVCM